MTTVQFSPIHSRLANYKPAGQNTQGAVAAVRRIRADKPILPPDHDDFVL